MSATRRVLREQSLSIVFGLLLLATLAGQALSGVADYNEHARTAGLQELPLWRYVTSSQYAVDVAENWQSEYLQFTLYILLTVWLVQRGSSESKKPGDSGRDSDEQQLVVRVCPAHLTVVGTRRRVAHGGLLALAGVGHGDDLRAVLGRSGGGRAGGLQRGTDA